MMKYFVLNQAHYAQWMQLIFQVVLLTLIYFRRNSRRNIPEEVEILGNICSIPE